MLQSPLIRNNHLRQITIMLDVKFQILRLHLRFEHVIDCLHQPSQVHLLLYFLELPIFNQVHIEHIVYEVKEQFRRIFDYVCHFLGLPLSSLDYLK